nr:carbohydrate-binding protein [Spirochaetaceae bacterium]
TTDWQDWTTVERTVYLPAGMQTLRINILSGGFNLNWINLARAIDDNDAPSVPQNLSISSTSSSITFNWSASTDNVGVAGYIVRIGSSSNITVTDTSYTFTGLSADTNYTCYVSAFDDAGNQSATASKNASTDADTGGDFELLIEAENYYTMSGIQTENCSEGGLNVGWIDNSDWFDFIIDVPETGTYTIEYRLASESSNGHFRFDTNQGNTVLDDVSVPSTGGWQNWTTVTSTVELTKGQMTVGVFAFSGGFNVNWIKISK